MWRQKEWLEVEQMVRRKDEAEVKLKLRSILTRFERQGSRALSHLLILACLIGTSVPLCPGCGGETDLSYKSAVKTYIKLIYFTFTSPIRRENQAESQESLRPFLSDGRGSSFAMPSDKAWNEDYPPTLTAAESEQLLSTIKDWSIANGLAVRPPLSLIKVDFDPHGILATTAPVTLFPSPFPRVCFEQAKSIQKSYNKLYAAIARDEKFLGSIVQE
jgi:hypothetical protein